MTRNRLLLGLVLVAVAGLAPAGATDLPRPRPARAAAEPPRTGFEQRAGASWTTHDEELAFLKAVDAGSDLVAVDVIGMTELDRPIHLVRIGSPGPPDAARGRTQPVELHVCSQHGNEPAGREACLIALRDLAFTKDATLLAQLARQATLFIPTANPDGRQSNSRTNSEGVDINRDHLNLTSLEARAMARVTRDWQPDISIDHHEYGPGTPVLYDDEVLYLWPRNLNVDDHVHDLAVAFSKEVLGPCLQEAGFTSDVYGVDAVGSTDVQQTAGGGDEGILRNAAGLRHVLGILVESAVTANPTNGAGEATTAGQQLRRVASQSATIQCTLGYMRESAAAISAATAGAAVRKTAEGRAQTGKVYFAGQDEDTTLVGNGDEEVSVDPPCGYDLTPAQLRDVREVLDLQAIAAQPRPGGGARVSMAQPAEPLIPLLLDARNTDRAETDATPLATCAGGSTASPAPPTHGPGDPPPPPHRPRPGAGGAPLPATGGPAGVAALAAVASLAALALRRR